MGSWSAPQSPRIRAADDGAHRRTRRRGNAHFIQSFQGQDVRNSSRAAASEPQLSGAEEHLQFGPSLRPQRLLFAILSPPHATQCPAGKIPPATLSDRRRHMLVRVRWLDCHQPP
jgi:hypothetical protein